ncbi:MAG: ATP-binding protein [Bacteroidaceae bacterium]|nr:ATP-binding protein [Bacteroidaceae bacterium]
MEQYKRGKDTRLDKEILSDKLYWTFQTKLLGNLVRKGSSTLCFSMKSDKGQSFLYTFGSSTTKSVQKLENTFKKTDANSIFIPAKEILSIMDIILDWRDRYSEFGFEDPYVDLARALSPTTKGRNYKSFADARTNIEEMVGGHLEYDNDRKEWIFKDNNKRIYEIALTSEGVKKLSILNLLLGNHFLSDESIIIIDEIEANLHPKMISRFLEVIVVLAQSGVQLFISTHSYFVIKYLYILAHKHEMNVPVLSFDEGGCTIGNLKEGMPKNPIIDESINLYKAELSL